MTGQGRVVGITDQIATGGSGADSFSGVGFAVPIDDVKSELAQLIAGDHVAHAYLGVGTGDANGANGALVGSVQPKSPSSNTLSVIDPNTFKATATIATGNSPYGIAVVQPAPATG